MATTDDKSPIRKDPEFKEIKAYKEPEELRAYDPAIDGGAPVADDVPPVTANTDSTPKGIAVGAAVLLGLAFGLGCWVWCDGEGRDQSLPQDVISYQAAQNKNSDMGLPTPFALYGLDYTTTGGSGIAAVRPVAQVPVAQTIAVPVATVQAPTVVKVSDQPLVYLFNYGQAGVPENTELTALAEQASRNGSKLDVRAYTDESGSPACNRRLSEKRAKAIAAYLEAHGVPASQITVKGMGPTHAYANNAQDRRAEVYVVK